MTGCPFGCKILPVGASATSVQGKELKAIATEHRQITITAPDNWPFLFGPVTVVELISQGELRLQAHLAVTKTGSPKKIQAAVAKMVQDLGLDPTGKSVSSFEVQLDYKDQQGNPCGRDTIVVFLDVDQGSVTLYELGKTGSPFSATTTLKSVVFAEPQPTDRGLEGENNQ
jgi:hypothetical protein